jgi:1-hydroxycarotenoid 3,4-desaturase
MRVAVIGAGFAGLAAALRLAAAGHQVTVLEAQFAAGGKAMGWQGVPTGPTVLTLPWVVGEVFRQSGGQAPALEAVSPLTRYSWPDGRCFAPLSDLEGSLVQLSSQEGGRYRALLETARSLFEAAQPTFVWGPPPDLTALARYGLRHGLNASPHLSLAQLVQSGPYLTPFFLRFATYLGANPYQAPAVLHNIAWVELGLGVYHLSGGMAVLAQQLHALAVQRGVKFHFGQKVLRLQGKQRQITQVETAQGRLEVDAVVSAIDRQFTRALLGLPPAQYPLGVSGVAVLMHLRQAQPVGHYLHFSEDYAAEWQTLSRGNLPGKPTLYLHTDGPVAFGLVNAPHLGALRDTDLAEYGCHLRDLLIRQFQLEVADWRLMTPIEYGQTGYMGALYGRAPHGLGATLRHGWQVRGWTNLVQVGGTVHPGGGVPLSLLSGWNGAGDLLGRMIEGSYAPLAPTP